MVRADDVFDRYRGGSGNDSLAVAAYSQARRSLDLLRAIENTLTELNWLSEDVQTAERRFRELSKRVSHSNGSPGIEDEEALLEVFDTVFTEIRRKRDELSQRRDSAESNRRLDTDDGLIDAFERAHHALEQLFEAIEALRWMVLDRGADDSPVTATFTNVDDLILQLKS